MQDNLQAAATHLSKQDPVLTPVIARAGLAEFKPHQDYYGALVNSIIGQQLSVKAAATIKQRFRDLFDGNLPTPEEILEKQLKNFAQSASVMLRLATSKTLPSTSSTVGSASTNSTSNLMK